MAGGQLYRRSDRLRHAVRPHALNGCVVAGRIHPIRENTT